jgi:Dolichyl-phosphate-mannose-protein mannosyltransferase
LAVEPGTRSAAAARLALAFVILVACLAAAGSWRIYSATWDEPEHLAAGIQLFDVGLYEYDTEHPPLGRLFLAAGPYIAGARAYGTPPPDGTQEGKDILYGGDHYELYLMLARAGTLPFLVLLLYSTWLWARRLLPTQGAAVLAVAILATVPPILGHAGLATLDVAAAATMLLALYAMQQWLTTASQRDALAFGLATGVAVATKFSAVPFLGLSLPAVVAMDWINQRRDPAARGRGGFLSTHLAGLALAIAAGLVFVLLVYTPRAPDAGGVEVRWDWAVNYLLHLSGWEHTLGVWLSHAWLPREFKDFLNGILAVKAHNDTGHRSYLFGHMSLDGWWYFYLVALAVKTPLPLLLAGPVGLVGLAREGWRGRDGWAQAPLVLVVTILIFASTFSRINIGIRHVLVLYPFLAVGAVYALRGAWRRAQGLKDRRLAFVATAFVSAALLWQFSTLVRAYPDYLPYFNETVRHPEHVLVDSDLDWGQDLDRLEDRAAQLKIAKLNLAYLGTVDLARESLPPYAVLKYFKPVHGWVAISALARVSNPPAYAWLDAYRPLERVGKTIDLYYIP